MIASVLELFPRFLSIPFPLPPVHPRASSFFLKKPCSRLASPDATHHLPKSPIYRLPYADNPSDILHPFIHGVEIDVAI